MQQNELTLLQKLSRDLKKAAETLSDQEARYLVDTYYQIQEYRKRSDNQSRELSTAQSGEPHELFIFFADNFRIIENQIKNVLHEYAKSKPIGQWLLGITGIGPVIAAGLLAHIDIKKVQTAGQIQAFAGLDPTKKWEKGQLRPWNAKLKVLCWKIGQSFVKVSNNDKDVYGKIYKIRKEYEQAKNEAGDYADQAAQILKSKNIGKDTDAYAYYSKGMLPPAHIQQRCERYAVKIFLSHLFSVWYEMDRGEKPPKPYAISILGHAHEIPIPNWPA